jgi:hypothetical protein
MKKSLIHLSRLTFAGALLLGGAQVSFAQTVVNGTSFTLHELVGVGRLAANLRDEHGETFGSISGLVADASTWTRTGNSYTGIFYASPDRGYNVAGTIDYTARINRIAVDFTPAASGGTGLGQNQIGLTLTQSTCSTKPCPAAVRGHSADSIRCRAAWPPVARVRPRPCCPNCRKATTASCRSTPKASCCCPMDRV